MYAVVETGGKQYLVEPGSEIEVERVDAPVGAEVRFDRVLLLVDGDRVGVGRPVLPGACALGRVVAHGRGRKIEGLKYKPKVNYRRRYGHRQHFTRVRIEAVADQTVSAEAEA